MGCPKPLPESIKIIIDQIDGERMTLATAKTRIGLVASDLEGENKVEPKWLDEGLEKGMLLLTQKTASGVIHGWRLLFFEDMDVAALKCDCGAKATGSCRRCKEPICFDHSHYHDAWEQLCSKCNDGG